MGQMRWATRFAGVILLVVFLIGCASMGSANLVEGENMLTNGSFDQGQDPWTPWIDSGWGGEGEVIWEDDIATLIIDNPGEAPWAVAMHYSKISLEKGGEYIFRFRARADEPRLIRTNIANGLAPADPPYLTYIEVPLTTEWQTFEYPFKMIQRSSKFARIDFNCAYNEAQFVPDNSDWTAEEAIEASDATVYIDDVELRRMVPEGSEG